MMLGQTCRNSTMWDMVVTHTQVWSVCTLFASGCPGSLDQASFYMCVICLKLLDVRVGDFPVRCTHLIMWVVPRPTWYSSMWFGMCSVEHVLGITLFIENTAQEENSMDSAKKRTC